MLPENQISCHIFLGLINIYITKVMKFFTEAELGQHCCSNFIFIQKNLSSEVNLVYKCVFFVLDVLTVTRVSIVRPGGYLEVSTPGL